MVKSSSSSSSKEKGKVKMKREDVIAAFTIAGFKYAEQTKQNARNSQAAPLVNPTVLEEAKTPRIQFEESSEISRKSGFGHGKNHSGSLEKHTVLDDEDEEEEGKGSKKMKSEISRRRNLDSDDEFEGKSKTPRIKIAESSEISRKSGLGHGKNGSSSLKKHTVLDDEYEEEEEEEEEEKGLKKMKSESSKRRILDGEKLSRYPQIEKILDIIGDCSDPFAKKLSKTDLDIDQDKISFHRYDFKRSILPLLKKDEILGQDKLARRIEVNTYDEFGNCYEMIFDTYNNAFYKLCNGWGKLLNRRKLKENEDCYVAVWAFRHVKTDGLCFALILKK